MKFDKRMLQGAQLDKLVGRTVTFFFGFRAWATGVVKSAELDRHGMVQVT